MLAINFLPFVAVAFIANSLIFGYSLGVLKGSKNTSKANKATAILFTLGIVVSFVTAGVALTIWAINQ